MRTRHRPHHFRFACRLGPVLYFAVLLLLALSLIAVDRMRSEPEPRGMRLSVIEHLAA